MGTAAVVAIIAAALAATAGGVAVYQHVTTENARDNAEDKEASVNASADFARKPGVKEEAELEAYLRDAVNLGYIDPKTYKDTFAVFTKLKNNNYDYSKLSKDEAKKLASLYDTLYDSDTAFHSLWNQQMSDMDIEDQLKVMEGHNNLVTKEVPTPDFLDANVSTYQKNIEPIKHLTNNEVADLVGIDYNFNNIKKDIDRAAEAEVNYSNWQSDLLANNEERNNNQSLTDYLQAISNTKSEAIQKGATNGARAAAEVLNNLNAIKTKATSEGETAQNRFQAVDDALLNRARSELNTYDYYTSLGKVLGEAGNAYYDADVDRIGQDWMSNAIYRNADENLRANIMALNNSMAGKYNEAIAQNQGYLDSINEPFNYFRTVSLPANDNDYIRALSDYLDVQHAQTTGYSDPMSKYGGMSKNANK